MLELSHVEIREPRDPRSLSRAASTSGGKIRRSTASRAIERAAHVTPAAAEGRHSTVAAQSEHSVAAATRHAILGCIATPSRRRQRVLQSPVDRFVRASWMESAVTIAAATGCADTAGAAARAEDLASPLPGHPERRADRLHARARLRATRRCCASSASATPAWRLRDVGDEPRASLPGIGRDVRR